MVGMSLRAWLAWFNVEDCILTLIEMKITDELINLVKEHGTKEVHESIVKVQNVRREVIKIVEQSQVYNANEIEGGESSAAKYQKLLETEKNMKSKSYVERHLADSREDSRKPLDILRWWEENNNKYTVLSQIARQYHVLSQNWFKCPSTLIDLRQG
ncbi:hypothetical protein RJ639_011953 [Escallonia herrerae]|uniref:HAT C-terminal dimerisation domain-containing protein n=1 Tax=Escallonia herrerae TaxID=1293975 RepID=A0AA89APJ8_9ASTE|nr:hypothetical protein RJ639_011953 [Escallonia herrerae]